MPFTPQILRSCLFLSLALLARPATSAAEPSTLRNDPAREEAFMDWGMGMFIHWSIDAELGSVISHVRNEMHGPYLSSQALNHHHD